VQRGLVSSGSHQGNSDLSAEVRLLRGETNPQGLDLAFCVRRPVAARFFAMFAKVGTTEAGSHAVAREERGEWSGRVHGPMVVGYGLESLIFVQPKTANGR
jgi:hypothetical protein